MAMQERPEVHRRQTRRQVGEHVVVPAMIDPDRELVREQPQRLPSVRPEREVREVAWLESPIREPRFEVPRLLTLGGEPEALGVVEDRVEHHHSFDKLHEAAAIGRSELASRRRPPTRCA